MKSMGHPKVEETTEQRQRAAEKAERINREIAENLGSVDGLLEALEGHYYEEINIYMVQRNGDGSPESFIVKGLLIRDEMQHESGRIAAGARDAKLLIRNPDGWVDAYPLNGVCSYIDALSSKESLIWDNPQKRFGSIGLYSMRSKITLGATSD